MADIGVEPAPAWHKIVGISLAVSSALFIGASFVIKKKGLIDTNSNIKGNDLGHAYLKNPLWWMGMIMMLLGEVFNLVAYAFSPAILVTPLGALSVVVSAFLSSLFLKERLSFAGKIGCFLCVVGSVIIVMFAPVSNSTDKIPEFFQLMGTVGFVTYSAAMGAIVVGLVFYAGPRYGKKFPLVYITVCSIVGSFSVVAAQGFGSSIVYSISHPENVQYLTYQFWLLVTFVCLSGIFQINYLNKALNLFSTAIVTPIYYVMFTSATLITSGILFSQFYFESAEKMVTIVLGFLVIIGGVALLFEYSMKLSRIEALKRIKSQKLSEDRRGVETFFSGNGGVEEELLLTTLIPLEERRVDGY